MTICKFVDCCVWDEVCIISISIARRQPVSGSGCSPGKQWNQSSYEAGASWFVADCPPRAPTPKFMFFRSPTAKHK